MNGLDPVWLGELIDRHAAALELYAAQWTTAPEDCVQEAFVELVKQPARPAHPAAWLFRVVRNRALSAARAHQRRRKHEAQAARADEAWFESAPDARLDAQTVTQALQHVPDEQREVIVARLWGGLSFDDIAQLTETAASTAFRRYEAGLAALRTRLRVPCPSPSTSRPT